MTTLMDATKALIRTGYAQPGRAWIRTDKQSGRMWIDFENMRDYIGGMGGGQKRLLSAIASMGEGEPVKLANVVVGLDKGAVGSSLELLGDAVAPVPHS